MKSHCVLFSAVFAALTAASEVRADRLLGNATATSVKVSLTLDNATFPNGPPFFNPGSFADIQGGAGPNIYNSSVGGSLLTSHSVGPLQANDLETGSTVQSAAGDSGALSNGNHTFTVSTNSNAAAVSGFAASAYGESGSAGLPAGIGLLPSAQPVSAVFDIDLIGDYLTNADAGYSVAFSELGVVPTNHFATTVISTHIETNLVGLSNLFSNSATIEWRNGVGSFTAGSFSPLIAQPLFATDYNHNYDGTYSLDPGKRHISIPFTIPAGTGFRFAVYTDTFVELVPEPHSIVTAGLASLALLAIACRRRLR